MQNDDKYFEYFARTRTAYAFKRNAHANTSSKYPIPSTLNQMQNKIFIAAYVQSTDFRIIFNVTALFSLLVCSKHYRLWIVSVEQNIAKLHKEICFGSPLLTSPPPKLHGEIFLSSPLLAFLPLSLCVFHIYNIPKTVSETNMLTTSLLVIIQNL